MLGSALVTAELGVFGALLCGAAVAKLAAPGEFSRTTARVLSPRWCARHPHLVAQSGRVLAFVELVAVPIVIAGGTVGAGLAVCFGVAFVGAVVQARHRGAACGCWGSLSAGQAGGAELAHALVLAAMVASAFAARIAGVPAEWSVATLVVAVLLLATLVAAGHLGRRLLPAAVRGGVPARGARRVAVFLLAAPASVRELPSRRPLWPWQNRRTLRHWRTARPIRDELRRVGSELDDLVWRAAVIWQTGPERRALISGGRTRLVVSETTGLEPVIRCRALPVSTNSKG